MRRWGLVLIFLLFANSLFAQDSGTGKEWIFIVQAAEENKYDTVWNPIALAYLKRLVGKYAPHIQIAEIDLESYDWDDIDWENGEDPFDENFRKRPVDQIHRELRERIASEDELRGFIFVGHGGPGSFSVTNTVFSMSGQEMAMFFRNLPEEIKLSPEFLAYFWSCASFERPDGVEDSDYNFDMQLAEHLVPFVGGPSNTLFPEVKRAKQVHLVGHQGTAGFADWLPALPTDWIYARNEDDVGLITGEEIKDKLTKRVAWSAGVTWVSAMITSLVEPSYTPYTVGAFPVLSVGWNIPFLSKLHYISKQARYLIVDESGVFYDRDLIAREGLRRMLKRPKDCRDAMALILSTDRD